MRFASLAVFAAASVAAVFAVPHVASACGGCFARPTEQTVVTDHRMALSISRSQTVLWDQIRYAGNPREFAWVLPVRDGARVELSRDDWFAALDATTQPVIYGPSPRNTRSGCALGACGSSSSDSAGSPGGDPVQVLRQDVVGPYETVTLRSTDPSALRSWLQAHGYAIPTSVEPVVDGYVNEGFDFIALRLLPDCNVRSMKPVRIVTPGADPTLPLRMVAAGVGAFVGLTLYVIGEGRYHPQNFPDATIDYGKLTWNRTTNRSNYQELIADGMRQGGDRAWVTEYAKQPGIGEWSYPTGPNPTLFDSYYGLCGPTRTGGGGGGQGNPNGEPCTSVTDAGADASDAASDAASDDGGDVDANADDSGTIDAGATVDAAPPPPEEWRPSGCENFDDLSVATRGMRPTDVWVTRLRANLRSSALNQDLRLSAGAQSAVDNIHRTSIYDESPTTSTTTTRTSGCSSAPMQSPGGAVALFALTVLGVRRLLRRRR